VVAQEVVIEPALKAAYMKVKRLDEERKAQDKTAKIKRKHPVKEGKSEKPKHPKKKTKKEKPAYVPKAKLHAHLDTGRVIHGGAHESDVFRFVVRAQPVCGESKQDTYFAVRISDGERVFVKGPYARSNALETPMLLYELRRRFFTEIQTPQTTVVYMIPDLVSPLSDRVKIDRAAGKSYPFLVTEDLTRGADLPTKIYDGDSLLWKGAEVVDWSKTNATTFATADFLAKDAPMTYEFCKNVLFRYLVGVGDAAERNFIVCDGGTRLVAVDDENCMSVKPQANQYRDRRMVLVRCCLTNGAHTTDAIKLLLAWRHRFEANRAEFGRVAEFVQSRFDDILKNDADVFTEAFRENVNRIFAPKVTVPKARRS
jgi:hypothetical protein